MPQGDLPVAWSELGPNLPYLLCGFGGRAHSVCIVDCQQFCSMARFGAEVADCSCWCRWPEGRFRSTWKLPPVNRVGPVNKGLEYMRALWKYGCLHLPR